MFLFAIRLSSTYIRTSGYDVKMVKVNKADHGGSLFYVPNGLELVSGFLEEHVIS